MLEDYLLRKRSVIQTIVIDCNVEQESRIFQSRGYSFDRWKLSNERRIFASYYTHIRWIHCSYALKLRNSGRNELFDRSKTDMSSSQSQRPLILMARAKQVSILLPPPPPFESIDATNDPWRREFEKRRR